MKFGTDDGDYIKSQHFFGHWKEVDKHFPGHNNHNNVYIPSLKKLFVINCHDESGQVVDAFIDVCHNPPEVSYIKNKTSSRLPATLVHFSATLMIDKVIVYGGCFGTNGEQSSDIYSFDLKTNQWEKVKVIGYVPRARDCHAAVHYGDGMMLVFGGRIRVKHSELSVSERLKLDQRNKKRTSAQTLHEDKQSVTAPADQSGGKKRKLTNDQGVKEEGSDPAPDKTTVVPSASEAVEAMDVQPAVEEPDEDFYDEQIEEMPATYKYIGVHTNLGDRFDAEVDYVYECSNDFLAFNFTTLTWEKILLQGDIPCGRYGHSLTIAPVGKSHYLYTYGGTSNQCNLRHHSSNRILHDNFEFLNDLYKLNLDNFIWQKVQFNPTTRLPRPRAFHTLTVINNNLFLYGGYSYYDCCYFYPQNISFFRLNQGNAKDYGLGKEWMIKKLTESSPLPCVPLHTAFAIGSELIVFGVHRPKSYLSNTNTHTKYDRHSSPSGKTSAHLKASFHVCQTEHYSCLALPPTSIYSDLLKMYSTNHLTDVVIKVRNGEIKVLKELLEVSDQQHSSLGLTRSFDSPHKLLYLDGDYDCVELAICLLYCRELAVNVSMFPKVHTFLTLYEIAFTTKHSSTHEVIVTLPSLVLDLQFPKSLKMIPDNSVKLPDFKPVLHSQSPFEFIQANIDAIYPSPESNTTSTPIACCHSSYINLRAKSLTNPDFLLSVDVLKMLLFCRCRSFRSFDLHDKDQLELKPMPQECFEVFVRFVYEGYAALSRLQAVVQKMGITTLFQLLSISIEYGLKDLQYHCENELFKVTNTNNMWTIYQIASSCNSRQLKNLTLLTITKLFCNKEDEEESKSYNTRMRELSLFSNDQELTKTLANLSVVHLEELYNSIEHFQKAKEFGSYGSHGRKSEKEESDARGHKEREDNSSYEEKETKKFELRDKQATREKLLATTNQKAKVVAKTKLRKDEISAPTTRIKKTKMEEAKAATAKPSATTQKANNATAQASVKKETAATATKKIANAATQPTPSTTSTPTAPPVPVPVPAPSVANTATTAPPTTAITPSTASSTTATATVSPVKDAALPITPTAESEQQIDVSTTLPAPTQPQPDVSASLAVPEQPRDSLSDSKTALTNSATEPEPDSMQVETNEGEAESKNPESMNIELASDFVIPDVVIEPPRDDPLDTVLKDDTKENFGKSEDHITKEESSHEEDSYNESSESEEESEPHENDAQKAEESISSDVTSDDDLDDEGPLTRLAQPGHDLDIDAMLIEEQRSQKQQQQHSSDSEHSSDASDDSHSAIDFSALVGNHASSSSKSLDDASSSDVEEPVRIGQRPNTFPRVIVPAPVQRESDGDDSDEIGGEEMLVASGFTTLAGHESKEGIDEESSLDNESHF